MKKDVANLCCTVAETNDNFVGVKYNKGEIKIIFPLGYRIPKDYKSCKDSIKQLFRTIKFVHERKIDYEDRGEYISGSNGLPIDSYQWIIKDYLNNGIYVDNEKIYVQDNKGKINWKRTFKTKFFVNKNSLVYLNPIVEKSNNIMNIITEIHSYCIDKSAEVLWFLYDGINKVSNVKRPNLKYYIKVINDEMLISFDDRKKMLLLNMKRIIQEEIDDVGNNDIKDYGIRHYEYAWEYMINEVYGTEDVKKYYPNSTYNIVDLGEFNASNLRPDTIMKDEKNNMYILDSKYYKAGIDASTINSLKKMLPSTESIQKQITYGDFIEKNYKEAENINNIYSAFIIPFDKSKNKLISKPNDIEFLGYATSSWKDLDVLINSKHLKIAVILVDTKYLIDSFFNKVTNQKLLIDKIKKVDKNS